LFIVVKRATFTSKTQSMAKKKGEKITGPWEKDGRTGVHLRVTAERS